MKQSSTSPRTSVPLFSVHLHRKGEWWQFIFKGLAVLLIVTWGPRLYLYRQCIVLLLLEIRTDGMAARCASRNQDGYKLFFFMFLLLNCKQLGMVFAGLPTLVGCTRGYVES
ncbi:hypothetical protein LOK49_LG04G00569 [Camellia lanceoleosa]|uniref:Uncharacterized protein n=1 Tax=Camellia lanceoleosa TaxID=1840588 RepID=A0ACC0I212_9ERIC|nr:hypothetical protein LOK49_LG04G00569 [Camellia lanceoleosa]